MGLDQLGVLTVGTLVPKETRYQKEFLVSLACCSPLVIRIGSHRSSLAPQGHYIRAGPMAHMVNRQTLAGWLQT